ncbi:MAG: hypothetical protein ABI361_02065 [Nitrososphaera sp.]|jgi:hypothetical protein
MDTEHLQIIKIALEHRISKIGRMLEQPGSAALKQDLAEMRVQTVAIMSRLDNPETFKDPIVKAALAHYHVDLVLEVKAISQQLGASDMAGLRKEIGRCAGLLKVIEKMQAS